MDIIGPQVISDKYAIGTITAISDTMIMTIIIMKICPQARGLRA